MVLAGGFLPTAFSCEQSTSSDLALYCFRAFCNWAGRDLNSLWQCCIAVDEFFIRHLPKESARKLPFSQDIGCCRRWAELLLNRLSCAEEWHSRSDSLDALVRKSIYFLMARSPVPVCPLFSSALGHWCVPRQCFISSVLTDNNEV